MPFGKTFTRLISLLALATTLTACEFLSPSPTNTPFASPVAPATKTPMTSPLPAPNSPLPTPTKLQAVSPLPTPTRAQAISVLPTPTIQPQGGPTESGSQFGVIPAAGALKHIIYDAGQPVAELSMFFMDTTTGKIDGWSLPGATPGQVMYSASADNRFVIAQTQSTGYLVDRTSNAIYQWPRSRLELVENLDASSNSMTPAISAHYLLFEAMAPHPTLQNAVQGTSRFIIARDDMSQAMTFTLRARITSGRPLALFSPDEKRLAVINWRALENPTTPDTDRWLHLVEVNTGKEEAISQLPAEGEASPRFAMAALPAGQEFAVVIQMQSADRPRTVIQRYTWQGKFSSGPTIDGAQAWLSPDGSLAAVEQWSGKTPSIQVVGIGQKADVFTVRGATMCYGDYGPFANRWLADSSGFVARTKDGFTLVALTPPALQAFPVNNLGQNDDPVPSPADANLFALGRLAVARSDGQRRSVTLAPALSPRPEHVAPWGATSKELRFSSQADPAHNPLCPGDTVFPAPTIER